MEFAPVTKHVEMFGIQETRSMSVASSAKVFYTLISGLYSRKIESIVREIVSNAFDGHTKRGNNDRPFFVHAPTVWEPWFAVRDYGCSIDHDTVLNNCSTIGWSSKENSNVEIGTWGYGMKSPFAYTSQFTLTCYLDGKKRTYSYHIDESGVPVIALRDERDSDEEQGVEVRFDVKKPDIHEFHRSIRWTALPYQTCFTSNLEDVHSAKITRDEGKFFLSPDADGPMVQVGPVWYKIDFSQLPDCEPIEKALKFKEFVLRSQIGDLGIVPSRESLEYTPKTVENLTRLLRNVFNDVTAEVAAKVDPAPDVWAAATIYRNMPNGPFNYVARHYPTKWGSLGELTEFEFDWNHRGSVQVAMRLRSTALIKKNRTDFQRGYPTAVFVFDQGKPMVSKPNLRMLNFMIKAGVDEAVVVNLPDPKVAVAKLAESLKKDKVSREERKLKMRGVYDSAKKLRSTLLDSIEAYGCPVVLYQDRLPEPYRSEEKRDTSIRIYQNSKGLTKWQESTAEPIENKINIVFELDMREFHPVFKAHKLKELIEEVTGLEVGEIIGVSKTNFSKFLKQDPEWTSYKEIFTPGFFDVAAMKERIRLFNASHWNGIEHHVSDAERIQRKLGEHLPTMPEPIQRVLDAARLATAEAQRRKDLIKTIGNGLSAEECQLLIRLVTGEYVSVLDEPDFTVLDDAMDNLKEVYPELMSKVSHYGTEDAAIYVLGLDALRATQAVSFYDAEEAA